HDYDPAELERCRGIAAEAAARFARLPIRTVDLGELEPFCLPANRGGKAPEELTPEFVRAAFRGTVHPWAKIEIKPAREFGVHSLEGGEVSIYGHGTADVKTHNRIWNETADWFEKHPDMGHGWYVAVEGGGLHGCLAVRLIVGLTRAGSLAGVATVELGSALTRTIPPEEMYQPLREQERGEFKHWFDPKTGRIAARAILRTFDQKEILAWNNKTLAAAKKLKAKDREAFWLAEFANLKPVRTLTLSPVWEAVQRCLTNGRFSSYPEPAEKMFFCPWNPFGGAIGVRLGFYAYSGDEVLRTANWLTEHGTDWLARRYDDLRATDYAGFMSEADKRAALDTYEAVR